MLIAVVLLGIAGFAAVWFRADSTLQELATGVLVDCREGRRAQVYENGAEAFRARWTRQQFEEYLDYWRGRLGSFESVQSRMHVSASTSPEGPTQSVTLVLEYEKGAAEGRFDFVDSDQGLRLSHLTFRIPLPDTTVHRAALVVPSQNLLREFLAGKSVEVYAVLAPDLQRSWGYTGFLRHATSWRGALGAVDTIAVTGAADESDDTVTFLFDLVGQRAKGRAKIGWHRIRKRWDVVEFTVEVGP